MNLKDLSKSHDNNFRDFLFYDIEVFEKDALVVFKDITGKTIAVFHNDFDGLHDVIAGKILVGYNNYFYDDYILSAMLNGYGVDKIKEHNDAIIVHNVKPGVSIKEYILSLDAFQQINVAKSSLKKVEANIGLSIDETAVDFNIDRPLTEKELEDTIKYCEQDVNATIHIFKLRWFSYFVPKLMIVSMLPEPVQKKALRWNTTTITANILSAGTEHSGWHEWRLTSDYRDNGESEKILKAIPEEVAEIWRDITYLNFTEKKDNRYTHHDMGCAFEFSQGGLHGVNEDGRKKFENVKLLDVTSLYPNIVLKLNALGEATTKYREIVNQRVEVKHTDQVLSNALKLVINSTYGLMKNRYSLLYNPMAALSVCIYGQVVLFDLCHMLHDAGYTLINVNTDGVAFTGGYSTNDTWKDVQKEWEDKYGFELELSEFKTWIQKDVNNYVAVDNDGNIKVKGGDVNHYYDPVDYVSDPMHIKPGVSWSGTNSLGIIHLCLVNKLIYGTDFIETILDNLQYPILFQYILQCGSTYIGTVDENGKLYQKVNRVFAAADGVTLKKQKELINKDGETKISLQYFPNAPKKMHVFNGDLRDFKSFSSVVDIDFYVNLAEQKWANMWR